MGGFSFLGLNPGIVVGFSTIITMILGAFGLIFYCLEGWVFKYKINRISARYFCDKTKGNAEQVVDHVEPGCMIGMLF